MKLLVIEPEAEADLADAFAWYENQREGLGEDLLLCVEAALEAVSQLPRSFPIVAKRTRRVLIRRFPYSMLFVEQANVISVIGLFHTSRSPRVWRRRTH